MFWRFIVLGAWITVSISWTGCSSGDRPKSSKPSTQVVQRGKIDYRERLGVASFAPRLLPVAMQKLPIGFYKDYSCLGMPFKTENGVVNYLPVIQYKARDDKESHRALVSVLWKSGQFPKLPGIELSDLLKLTELSKLEELLVARFQKGHLASGDLLVLGNEPGYKPNSDLRTPAEIISDAILLLDIFKRNELNLRLALGGVSTSKNQFTLDAYGGRTGMDFFKQILEKADGKVKFDAFIIHPYASDPLRPSAADSIRQIVEFRQVMKEFSLRDADLIVGEVGVPFADANASAEEDCDYLEQILEFCLTKTDDDLGNPNDKNLLVQKLIWYTLCPPDTSIYGFSTSKYLDLPRSALLTSSGELTELGKSFKSTVERLSHRE